MGRTPDTISGCNRCRAESIADALKHSTRGDGIVTIQVSVSTQAGDHVRRHVDA